MSREDHDWRRPKLWRADPASAPIPEKFLYRNSSVYDPIPATTTTLPDPLGSVKQAAWARKIRSRKWAALLKAAKAADPASAAATLRWLASAASASWWIDGRDLSPIKLWASASASAATPPTGGGPVKKGYT